MVNICIDVGRYETEERKGELASHCGSQHRLHMESFPSLTAAVGATITVSAAAATVTTVNLGPVSRLRRDPPWGPTAFWTVLRSEITRMGKTLKKVLFQKINMLINS